MIASIRNILYCTDLSGNSAYAFRYAATLAKIADCDIHILHVVEKLSEDAVITLQAFIQDPQQRKQAIHERKVRARKVLDERQKSFWEKLGAEGKSLRAKIKSIEIVESYPAEAILNKSIEHGCDLIIMGSHERGVGHNFLGSVAKSVLRRSRVPTLVVPLPEN